MTAEIKNKSKEEPAEYEESERTSSKRKKLRGLDFSYLHKRSRVQAKYKERSAQKIQIGKDKKRKNYLIYALPFVIFVALIITIFIDSKLYNLLRLAESMRNQKVLIGFQNSAELRPTGGFWGSFAYLDVGSDLADSSLYFETNPYKKDNPLLAETSVDLPTPMKETWPDRPQSFVNANWAIDFPQAAKTIEWYFGQGWDRDSDAVIAVSSLSIIDLLKLTGSIEAKDETVITSENFTEVMSRKIDIEYWDNPQNIKINEPKTILMDIAPQIIEKTKNLPRLTLYKFLLKQFGQGRILAYFNDEKQENTVRKLGISGESKSYRCDYLQINNANLNGNKTSLNIVQKIDYRVGQDGEKIHSTLTISRTFLGGLYPEVLNRNYTRAVVPIGSRLISASLDSKDITDQVEENSETDKATFGFWFSTGPGETKTAVLEYELPVGQESIGNYQLVVQKQPGTLDDYLEIDALGKQLFSGKNENTVLILP